MNKKIKLFVLKCVALIILGSLIPFAAIANPGPSTIDGDDPCKQSTYKICWIDDSYLYGWVKNE